MTPHTSSPLMPAAVLGLQAIISILAGIGLTKAIEVFLSSQSDDTWGFGIVALRPQEFILSSHWESLLLVIIVVVLVLRFTYFSILKFFQVDSTGMFRMTSSARYFKQGVGSSRPN